MCIVDFKARAPEVFKDTTGIKGITEGKRMPSWIASYAWKCHESNACREHQPAF
jgi:hypothetical protein